MAPDQGSREFDEALEDIRRRWACLYVALSLVGVVLIGALCVGSAGAWSDCSAFVGLVVMLSWALTIGCWMRILLARCPRCGELFHMRGSFLGGSSFGAFSGKCVHCGLPLRSPDHS